MLKTVLELRGEKRFRRARGNSSAVEQREKDDNSFEMNKAKITLRRIANKSSYNRSFGERPKDEEAYRIVKKNKFSELDFTSILKPEPLAMLEKWVQFNNEDEFTARVYFTLRSMYTKIRGQATFNTTSREHFIDAPQFAGKAPRFDLFEKAQNATIREK